MYIYIYIYILLHRCSLKDIKSQQHQSKQHSKNNIYQTTSIYLSIYLSIYIYIYIYIYVNIYIYIYIYMEKKHIIYLKPQIFLFFSEALSM